jgi:hypothetical protein
MPFLRDLGCRGYSETWPPLRGCSRRPWK